MAHVIFFRFLPMNNALSSSRADARETVSSNEALEKENFDDWYTMSNSKGFGSFCLHFQLD